MSNSIVLNPGDEAPATRTAATAADTSAGDLLSLSVLNAGPPIILGVTRPIIPCRVAGVVVRILQSGVVNLNPTDPESIPNSTQVQSLRVVKRTIQDPQLELPDVLEDLTDVFVVTDHPNGLTRGDGEVLFFRNTLDKIAQPGERLDLMFTCDGDAGAGRTAIFQILAWPLVPISSIAIL